MNLRIVTLIIINIFFTGCAHYFKSNSDTDTFKNTNLSSPICIQISENSIRNEKEVFLDEDHKTHGKIISKIKSKYPKLVYDCNAVKKITIHYSNIQDKKNLDYFILSFGIIPIIAKSNYILEIYDENKTIVYKSQLNGNIVLSVFFIPFFFLHKHDYEIIFEEIDKYLKEVVINQT